MSAPKPTPNQVFVGLPWRTVKPKYERCIARLHRRLPVYFHIVGSRDSQDAEDLLQRIKHAIDSSTYAVFDATGANANVALEFGYAEATSLGRALYLSDHRRSIPAGQSAIISDLAGKKQNRYKNESTLHGLLLKLAMSHAFTARYERAVRKLCKGLTAKQAKRARITSLRAIRLLDGHTSRRREEVVDSLELAGHTKREADKILRGLHKHKIVRISPGRFSSVSLA